MSDPKQIFTAVYTNGIWPGESRSGEGSSVEAAAAIVREIPHVLKLTKAQSLLDIPCGDFTWMRNVEMGETEYIGADIVEALIEDNNRLFSRPGRTFHLMDLSSGSLPKVDLILSRDCFIHLNIPMVFSCLNRIVDSESKYLLTSHYPWRGFSNNDEIEGILLGGRRINLEVEPFNFPAPLHSIPENEKLNIAADKSLCLWTIESLRQPLRVAEERYRSR